MKERKKRCEVKEKNREKVAELPHREKENRQRRE